MSLIYFYAGVRTNQKSATSARTDPQHPEADTDAHVTLQLAFPRKLHTFLYTAINISYRRGTAIAVITAVTAIIMEFNEEHIEALLKDLTPSTPPPSPWQAEVITIEDDAAPGGPSNPIAFIGHPQRSRKNYQALAAALSDAGNPARVLKLFIKREHGVIMKSKDIYNLLWRRGLTERRVMNQAERAIKLLEDYGFTLQHDIAEDTGRLKSMSCRGEVVILEAAGILFDVMLERESVVFKEFDGTLCLIHHSPFCKATAPEEIVNVLALHDDTMLALDEQFKDAHRVASVGRLSHQGFMVLSTALAVSDEEDARRGVK
ncbi:hypothetical protein E4U13_003129 [Claviceps humidiphila]|uniref:Uncharacterized protein n=1 Tax=Claviceps humidiphila TaxID=1294629 RepID=A0A9P7Q070_9HYPO|nr:hypothetical protein E4U13_003129 [Claviceps humidiphila]